jgi:enamine deaminase RidA (YjgF/YER057c/UK114 family)
MRKPIKVPGLSDSSRYGYEQCILSERFVFVAGQTGVDENYNVVSDDFEPQCRQALNNVKLALEAAGSSMDDIVTMTIFLTRMSQDFKSCMKIRSEFIKADKVPASAAIGVSALAYPNLLVEIQAIGVLSD